MLPAVRPMKQNMKYSRLFEKTDETEHEMLPAMKLMKQIIVRY